MKAGQDIGRVRVFSALEGRMMGFTSVLVKQLGNDNATVILMGVLYRISK